MSAESWVAIPSALTRFCRSASAVLALRLDRAMAWSLSAAIFPCSLQDCRSAKARTAQAMYGPNLRARAPIIW